MCGKAMHAPRRLCDHGLGARGGEGRRGVDLLRRGLEEGARERIEAAFRSAIERLSGPGVDAQCPEPRADETVAVNAQFDAEAFNRRMGAKLHAVPTSAFLGSRQIPSPAPSRT